MSRRMHDRSIGVGRLGEIERSFDRTVVTDDSRRVDRAAGIVLDIAQAHPFIRMFLADPCPAQRPDAGRRDALGEAHGFIVDAIVTMSSFSRREIRYFGAVTSSTKGTFTRARRSRALTKSAAAVSASARVAASTEK